MNIRRMTGSAHSVERSSGEDLPSAPDAGQNSFLEQRAANGKPRQLAALCWDSVFPCCCLFFCRNGLALSWDGASVFMLCCRQARRRTLGRFGRRRGCGLGRPSRVVFRVQEADPGPGCAAPSTVVAGLREVRLR